MVIGIDARPLVEKKTGFGFFLENILLEILKRDQTNEYILFSDREVCFDVAAYFNLRICRYHDTFLFRKSFYYYYRLATFLKRSGISLDVFWATEHFMPRGLPSNVKKVLTIYDFTHILYPKSTTKYNLLLSRIMFGPSIKRSDDIACISNNTRKELQVFYPKEVHNQKIVTIYGSGGRKNYSGKEIPYEKVSDIVKQIAKQPYILFVGTIEPRKNIPLLIEAAGKLKTKIHIVVCGKIGWESAQVVNQLKNTENLTYLNYVSQEDKEFLLQNCFCQVQPSLYEGFGLPVIESMQSGTVALVADNSSLRELVEMQELRFETRSSDSFCERILALQNDCQLYKYAQEYCNARGKDFDWGKTAEAYLNLFGI